MRSAFVRGSEADGVELELELELQNDRAQSLRGCTDRKPEVTVLTNPRFPNCAIRPGPDEPEGLASDEQLAVRRPD